MFKNNKKEIKSREQIIFEQIIEKRKEIESENTFQDMADKERLATIDTRIPFEIFAIDLGISAKFVLYDKSMFDLYSAVKSIVMKTPEYKFTDFKKYVGISGIDRASWWETSIAKSEYQELLELVRGQLKIKSPEDISDMIEKTNNTGQSNSYVGLFIEPTDGSFFIQTVLTRGPQEFFKNTTAHNISRYTVVDNVLYEEHYNQVLDNSTGLEQYAASSISTEDFYGKRTHEYVKKDQYKNLIDNSSRTKG